MTYKQTKSEITVQYEEFNAREFCSRKLWQMINDERDSAINECQLEQAVAELANRRHYLEELSRMGKLGESIHNA